MTAAVTREGVTVEEGAQIAESAVFAGAGITVGAGAILEPACVIGTGVSIGRGAWLRAGAVALRDVPPNAILEGNPAEVVGYRPSSDQVQRTTHHVDLAQYLDPPRPTRIDLAVGGGALYLMRKIGDPRGSLTVGELPDELPFQPARYFTIFDVPSTELRGEHAHRRCEQFLLCVHGSCRVLLDDGVDRCEVTLDRPDVGVHMPPMIWGTQYRYSRDAVLLVFASRPYENEDYIRDYDTFLAEVEAQEQ